MPTTPTPSPTFLTLSPAPTAFWHNGTLQPTSAPHVVEMSPVQQSIVVFITLGVFLSLILSLAVATSVHAQWIKSNKAGKSIRKRKDFNIRKVMEQVEFGNESSKALPHFWDRRIGYSAMSENFVSKHRWLIMFGVEERGEKCKQAALLVATGLTLMFWDAVFYETMFGPADNASCSQWTSMTSCTEQSQPSCHWEDSSQICDIPDFQHSFRSIMQTPWLSILLTLPVVVLIKIVMKYTVLEQFPPKIQDVKADLRRKSSYGPEWTMDLEKVTSSLGCLHLSEDSFSAEQQKKEESVWRKPILCCCMNIVRRPDFADGRQHKKIKRLILKYRVEEERDLFQRDLIAKEGPFLWRKHIPEAIAEPIIENNIRWHVCRAIEMESELARLVEIGGSRIEQDILVLRAAEIDSLNPLQYHSSKWMLEYISKKKSLKEAEPLDLDRVKEKSRNVVMRLHAIGWLFIMSYCCVVAFYTCHFEMRHSENYAKAWLLTFIITVLEDFFVIQPLKIFALYVLFPLAIPKKFRLDRLVNLPSYASSSQIARRQCSELFSSQVILNRTTELPGKIPEELERYISLPGRQDFKKGVHRVMLYIVVGVPLCLMLILPENLQEPLVEAWIAFLFNKVPKALKMSYDRSIWCFGVLLALWTAYLFYGIRAAVISYHQAANFVHNAGKGGGNAQSRPGLYGPGVNILTSPKTVVAKAAQQNKAKSANCAQKSVQFVFVGEEEQKSQDSALTFPPPHSRCYSRDVSLKCPGANIISSPKKVDAEAAQVEKVKPSNPPQKSKPIQLGDFDGEEKVIGEGAIASTPLKTCGFSKDISLSFSDAPKDGIVSSTSFESHMSDAREFEEIKSPRMRNYSKAPEKPRARAVLDSENGNQLQLPSPNTEEAFFLTPQPQRFYTTTPKIKSGSENNISHVGCCSLPL